MRIGNSEPPISNLQPPPTNLCFQRSIIIFSLYFIRGVALGFSAMATPGPFQAFLVSQTIKNGWRHTLPTALAPLVSDGPIVVLMFLLLTQTPNWFLSGVQILGGLFVLYLAWGAFVAAKRMGTSLVILPEAASQNFLKATLMNMLSPGPYLFWGLLAGPIVIDGWRQSPAMGLSFVVGFYMALIGGFAAFIILLGTASRFGPRVSKTLGFAAATALFVFGLYQLWWGVSTFVD